MEKLKTAQRASLAELDALFAIAPASRFSRGTVVNTLRRFSSREFSVPSGTSWYLADLGEFRGKQELYTRQSPQRLKALREHALIESAVSSNRLEGVEVDPKRLHDVLAKPKLLFRDRDEEEVRGYREALSLIHDDFAAIGISEEAVRRVHRMTRGEIWDAGKYKENESDIIERLPDERRRVRFRTVLASETARHMAALVADWQRCLQRTLGPSAGGAGLFQSRLSLHSSVSRRQRARLAAVVASSVLPSWL